MKKLAVIVLIVLGWSGLALGADWKPIGTSPNGSKVFYDASSIQKSTVTKVWCKIVLSKADKAARINYVKGMLLNNLNKEEKRQADFFIRSYEDSTYSKGLAKIACGDRRIQFVSTSLYGQNGLLLQFPDDDIQDVEPESVDELIYNTICK